MHVLRYIIHNLHLSIFPRQSSTVRVAFPLVFTIATLLTATALVSNDVSYVRLESSVSSVRAGDLFSINVYATAHVPVNAVDIALSFPKEQISVIGIDTGESVITLWTEEPYVKDDVVILRGGTFRKGFIGDHLIATINVKAKETGAAQFRINATTLLAGDGSGSKVKVVKTGEEEREVFVVHESGSIPTKESIALKSDVSVAIATDIDGDGNVTLGDISRFMSAWNTKSSVYDFNGDGVMSFRDFGIILADSFIR